MDKYLADAAKFRSLEYVEVSCVLGGDKEAPDWWADDTGGRVVRKRRGKGKQRQQGSPLGVDSTIDGLAADGLPWELRYVMNGVADFHRHKKPYNRPPPLTKLFPRLSARGILWCGICANAYQYRYPLHITPSNLSKMKSFNWRPRHCLSLFMQDLDFN